jgi:uncharacterized membrane protein YhiD involved in acid resistance
VSQKIIIGVAAGAGGLIVALAVVVAVVLLVRRRSNIENQIYELQLRPVSEKQNKVIPELHGITIKKAIGAGTILRSSQEVSSQ